jgi:hypothetical protein
MQLEIAPLYRNDAGDDVVSFAYAPSESSGGGPR